MAHLKSLVFLACAISLALAANHQVNNHGHAIVRCHSCQGVRDLNQCTHVIDCKHGEVCYTDLYIVNGERVYQKGCWKAHECPLTTLFGKRNSGYPFECQNCCPTSGCNMNDRCDTYQLPLTNGTATQQPAKQTTAGAILGVPAPDHSKMCLVCHGEKDPAQCTQMHKCHPDDACYTDVRIFGGENYFFKGCKPQHQCPLTSPLIPPMPIGKRAPHIPHEHDLKLVCGSCCYDNQCNMQTTQCDSFLNSATTMAPTVGPTVGPTQMATTADLLSACRDHEEDGFNCTTYDQYNFCTVTDTTALAYNIARTKCPKHCGLCTTTQPVPTTTAVPCVDHEEDGFYCADYDQYNFCTDTNSIAYTFAHQKCPKHCNFCQAGGAAPLGNTAGVSTSRVTLTSTHQTTAAAPIVQSSTQPPTIGMVTQVVSQASQGGNTSTCADFEDSTFSCVSWASNGFCTSQTGVLHEITVMRCSKHCGLCT